VSLLLREEPAEPGARVALLYESDRTPVPAPRVVDGIVLRPGDQLIDHTRRGMTRREPEGELIPTPGRLLRRRGFNRYDSTVNGRIMSLSSCSTMWQW
jgi:hypothetical protein